MICPVCSETLLGHPTKCYKCGAALSSAEAIAQSVAQKEGEYLDTLIHEKNYLEDQNSILEREKEELALKIQQIKAELNNARTQTIVSMNPQYEYDVVRLADDADGNYNLEDLQNIIRSYAENRWRLSFVFTNELGKNSSSVGIGGISSGTNATIETITLIFERCVDFGR